MLFHRPKLVLADEPTGNLDPANAVTVLDALREYADAGAAVLMVTHDPHAAEMWFWKAIEGFKTLDELNQSVAVSLTSPTCCKISPVGWPKPASWRRRRWPSSRRSIRAAEIWTTYNILAEITDREAAVTADPMCRQQLADQARQHRQAARQAKRNFTGTRYEMQRIMPFVVGVVMAVPQPEHRVELDGLLGQLAQGGGLALVAAIRRILDGERDEERLVDGLGPNEAAIIETILHALEDPASLAEFMPG